ncbi:MAG: rRNA maturation RNase YbeY [Pseudomonadota bacterium]
MTPEVAIDDAGGNSEWRPEASEVQRWAEAALGAAGESAPVALSFKWVTPGESQQLNREYRQRDKPTNVLSFPMEMPPVEDGEPRLLGDIAICPAVVAVEAAEQGKKLPEHWAHMSVHGVLHLLGYDHEEETQALEMEALERDILASFGIEDPYR